VAAARYRVGDEAIFLHNRSSIEGFQPLGTLHQLSWMVGGQYNGSLLVVREGWIK
jgi:hypothetical protein